MKKQTLILVLVVIALFTAVFGVFAAPAVDLIPPVLTITGAEADGNPLPGDVATGFILATERNPATSHQVQFAAGSAANEALEAAYFPLTLISSTVSAADLKAYYDARGVPEPYLGYLKDAADGAGPFAYIKGDGTTAVMLLDAAQLDLASTEVGMLIPDDYPVGSYTVQGVIRDLAGNETTVTLTLHVTDGPCGVIDYSLGFYKSAGGVHYVAFTYENTGETTITDINGTFDMEVPWARYDGSTVRQGGFFNEFRYASTVAGLSSGTVAVSNLMVNNSVFSADDDIRYLSDDEMDSLGASMRSQAFTVTGSLEPGEMISFGWMANYGGPADYKNMLQAVDNFVLKGDAGSGEVVLYAQDFDADGLTALGTVSPPDYNTASPPAGWTVVANNVDQTNLMRVAIGDGTTPWGGASGGYYAAAAPPSCPGAYVTTEPADDLLLCGESGAEVIISINAVEDLYAYQFDVSYNASVVEEAPVPAFINGWFTADSPFGTKSCSAGTCSFAATRQLTNDGKDGVSGTGAVAKITLTAAPGAGGTFPVAISNLVMGTRDGVQIPGDAADSALQVTVCGQANVTGKIALQGRFSGPVNPGTVTFTELDGNFTAPAPVSFDAAGNYSVTLNVLPAPTGSNYTVAAAHNLYISNKLATYNFQPGAQVVPQTELRGGDANLQGDPEMIGPPYVPPKDQLVDIYDLQCISTGFGPGSMPCLDGTLSPIPNSGSNINADAQTNVLDLGIAAGNFDRFSFRDWLTPDFP